MASYEELSNSELRKKLLDFGYDLPVSINRDFLLKKLQSAAEAKSAEKSTSGLTKRKSVAPSHQNPSKNNNTTTGISTSTPESKPRKSRVPQQSSVEEERSSNQNQAWNSNTSTPSNSQQSHRYSAYLNFFKGSGGDDPGASTPLYHGREGFQSGAYTRKSLPNFSYSYQTTDQAGNTYSNSNDSDLNASQSSSGARINARLRKMLGAVNPVNWASYIKQKISSTTENTGGGQEQGTATYGHSSGSAQIRSRSRVSTPAVAHLNNGHWNSGSPGDSPGSRIYSPAVPPGRQAGFKAFFSKQRNGVSERHSQNNTSSSDWENSPKISKILVAILIMFFLIVGAAYIHQRTNSGTVKVLGTGGEIATPKKTVPATVVPRKANYAICGMEGVDNMACVPKEHVKASKRLFDLLKEELVQRAKWKGCGSEVEDKITLQSAKNLLYRLSDMPKSDVDKAFKGLIILCNENPSWGLAMEINGMSNADKTSQEVLLWDNVETTITAVGVMPNFVCLLWNGLYTTTAYGILLTIIASLCYMVYKTYIYYQNYKKREEAELYDYVERIIDILYQRYEQVKDTGEEAYLAVSHIRDQLVPPKDRQRKAALWTKVVNYISSNESRVREEIQHISGEEYRVWRWLPSASPLSRKSISPSTSSLMRHSLSVQQQPPQPPSPQTLYPSLNDMSMDMSMSPGSPNSNNKWQGQAFEISDGSVNALPVTPTTCLKIRQMFDTEVNSSEPGQTRIERAILEKCPNSHILHIGVDSNSQEGCVYVKCLTREDARSAYMALHGWWFDGHLLSVKFLREERYVARFPESRQKTVPMTLKFYPQQSTSFNARLY